MAFQKRRGAPAPRSPDGTADAPGPSPSPPDRLQPPFLELRWLCRSADSGNRYRWSCALHCPSPRATLIVVKPLPRLVLALLLVATSVGCDQATKNIASDTLRGAPPRSYAADTFRLTYLENPGSFLGLGGALPEAVRYLIFVVGIGLLLLGLIAFVVFSRAPAPATVAGIALLLGG